MPLSDHYTDTTGIVINQKIIASALKTAIQTLDEKIYNALMGLVEFTHLRLGNFDPVTVSAGVATLSKMGAVISAETGTSDTIDNLVITPSGVQMIIIKAAAGHTLTLTHNTGNMFFASGTDYTLQDTKRLVLFRDPDNNKFYDMNTSGGGGGGGGGVTSVGLSVPSFLGVAGSPITSSGTLTVALTAQLANKIFAGPTSGGSATPTFRSMVLADLPSIAASKLLGRNSAGAGVPEEITLGTGLSMSGSTLNASGSGGDGGSSGNLILNGSFENWERGTSAVPDGWAIYGAASTIAREGTIIKHGTYSAKLTRVGNDCSFSFDAYAKGGSTYMRGRTYVLGAWVYATLASRVRLQIYDGTTTTSSAFHSGGSTWEYLTVSATIGGGATIARFGLSVETGNTSGYIDGATVSEGTVLTYPNLPGFNPNQIQSRATMWHHEALAVSGNAPVQQINASQVFSTYAQQGVTRSNGDAFSHSFYIRAGTYTLSILGITQATAAKVDWYIDGVITGITGQDWYSASQTFNIIKTGSITVVGDGYHVIKGVVNGRNASNTTDWILPFTKYWLTPTSD